MTFYDNPEMIPPIMLTRLDTSFPAVFPEDTIKS
jgi:hypothetical protein